MEALSYEYLLRRVYQVGRGEKDGADADEYRDMEHAESILRLEQQNIKERKPRISTQSINELEYEYRVQCNRVWRFVSSAIRESLSRYAHQLNENEKKQLQECLNSTQQIKKEDIDRAVKIATDILATNKIYPA